MTRILCVDFGSTFTKAVLLDPADGRLLAAASVPTTISTDVLDGYRSICETIAVAGFSPADEVLACSSAGGGLRLAVVGYERSVTAEAGYRVEQDRLGEGRPEVDTKDPCHRRGQRGLLEGSAAALGQRAVEVVDEVLSIFDAGRQAHQISGHLQLGPANRSVRHACRVLDQRLDATEALTQGPDRGRATDVDRLLLATGNLEGDHAPVAPHLSGRDVVPRVRAQTRVVHGNDRAMALQELNDLLGVLAVAVHPHAQGLQTSQHQPRIERSGNRDHGVLMEGKTLFGVLEPGNRDGLGRHDRAADDVTVTAAVLRGRVHDDVSAEGKGLLEVRRGERVVHGQDRAGLVSHGRKRTNVGNSQQRVGRRLDPYDLGLTRSDRGTHRLDVGDPCDRVLHPPWTVSYTHLRVRAAIGIAGDDDMVTGFEQRPDHRVLPSQTRGERETAATTLERRQTPLQRGAGRVGRTAVLIAAPKAADSVLFVGRDLVDRRHDGPGCKVRLLPRMDRAGVESSVVFKALCVRGGHVAKATRVATTSDQASMSGDSLGQPQEERMTTRPGNTRDLPTGCSPTMRACSCSTASRPRSRLGWRTVVRAGDT